MTGSASYRECWEETMGDRGASAVALVNALLPGLGILSYSAILSQTLQSLFESMGWNVPRESCLLLLTATVLLPLCLLKNLDVLAPFSALGTTAIVFCGAVYDCAFPRWLVQSRRSLLYRY
jgi:amino acid permease